MHLQMAEQIKMSATNENGRLRQQLDDCWPAFYMGSIAPDVNTISDITRVDTHFYDIPPQPDDQAVPTMLAKYPKLADGAALPPAQATFIAAYCAHLMLDLIWSRQIIYPYFVKPPDLGERKQRWLIHFTLLAYLDTLALADLPHTAVSTLAQPQGWLPFADDEILIRWRDMLVDQLRPGAPVKTIEIYAQRLRVTPDEFRANLQDETWMASYLFGKIPVDDIKAILKTAIWQSLDLIKDYLFPHHL
jgi:hypothetical protein